MDIALICSGLGTLHLVFFVFLMRNVSVSGCDVLLNQKGQVWVQVLISTNQETHLRN